jgi:tetratricopeptide (TPR) repeat protein
LGIFERIDDTIGQVDCLNDLAWVLFDDKQLNAAEDAASRAIDLIPKKDQEYTVCGLHRILGLILQSKGEKDKAIHHFKTALAIASPFGWHDELFWNHLELSSLFRNEDKYDQANAHIKQAKPHAVDNIYWLGRAMSMQAGVWYREHKLEDAQSEALHALKIFEELGAVKEAGFWRELLGMI